MPFWKCLPCFRLPTDDNITELDYSNGTLTNVPPVSQFERTLEQLYLSSNRISDLPPELFYCEGLRILKINDNELETIPNAIGSLRQLQVLDLSRNALVNIPDNIKSCKCLTHLDLSLNNLQRLPDAITSLITLQQLLLNETYLEFLPANFGRLVNLKILELRSNSLVTLPKSMSRLTELRRIDIGANEFTELPEVIGQLINLRELWIDNNRIRRIPSNISNLRQLIHFEATCNQLTSFSNEISNWRNLEVLSLSSNDLESLPFSIGMLKRLITLKCDSNQLKELPDSICHLEQLEELFINHNFIVRLPTTIGLLRKMKFLIADENLLRKLPVEISSCISLSVMSLRGNKLTELPHDIGHLKHLKVINIVDNLIRSLPVSVLNLTNLSALWISDNQSQPLVPLQYADNASKTELTCFMLPQINGSNKNIITLNSEQTINDANGSWYQQVQMCNGSPSRRICFADEANDKPNDVLATRLLRSPTPYPKELRQMAKFASRNSSTLLGPYQHQQQNQNEINTTVPPNPSKSPSPVNLSHISANPTTISATPNHHIREAKVLHNSQLITAVQSTKDYLQQHNQHPTILPSTSSLIANCDNLTNVQFYLPGASSTIINDCVDNEQHYANHTLAAPVDFNYNGLEHQQQRPHPSYLNSEKYYDTLSITNSTSKNSGNENNHTNGDYTPTWSPESPQEFYPKHYHRPPTYNTEPPPQQQQQFQHHQRPHEPPPYHIAKAYTRKSRQDLLTYDSIRTRNNSMEFMNNLNSYDSASRYVTHSLPTSSPLENVYQKIINKFETNSNISNNNMDNSNPNSISSDTLHNGNHMEDIDETDHYNISQHEDDMSVRLENHQQDEHADGHLSLTKQKSSPAWLFGVHRNPTVKQVILKKGSTLDFEIKEIENRGIFVSNTIPNTLANELLRIDDKILDVDGVDFSKINHRDAQQILIDSGPILNIMISRT